MARFLMAIRPLAHAGSSWGIDYLAAMVAFKGEMGLFWQPTESLLNTSKALFRTIFKLTIYVGIGLAVIHPTLRLSLIAKTRLGGSEQQQ